MRIRGVIRVGVSVHDGGGNSSMGRRWGGNLSIEKELVDEKDGGYLMVEEVNCQ